MKKTGALEMSVQNIVILIIAVIILGLIIGFVTKVFDSATDQLESRLRTIPEPQSASASNPIVIAGSTTVKRGEYLTLKLSVFNPTSSIAYAISPAVDTDTCAVIDLDESIAQTIPGNIDPKSAKTFGYSAKIRVDASPGSYVCKMKADDGTENAPTQDVVITVTS